MRDVRRSDLGSIDVREEGMLESMPDESAGGDLLGNPSTARRLSPGETFYWLVDRICSTNFTVAARLTGPLDHDALSASLSAVQGRHPLLRVRISAEKEGPVFRTDGVGPIPLRAAAVPEGVWIAEAEREINETFDWRRGPLIRCVWLRHQGPESTLMVTFHHAVGDGISGGYLMRDLLGAMAAPGRHRSPPLPEALPEALDRLGPSEVGGARGYIRYFGELFRAGKQIARYGRLRAVNADARAPYRTRRARVIANILDPSFTTELVARTRREGTTVHGALSAAVLLGGLCEIPAREPVLMALGSPVNMRDRVNPPVGEMAGMYASAVGTIHRVGKGTPFWDLAREIRGAIDAGFTRKMYFTYEPMTFRILSRLRRFVGTSDGGVMRFARLATAFFPSAGFGLTNIGKPDIEEGRAVPRVSWVALLPSWSVFAHSGWSSATVGGRLSFTFVYMEPLLARTHAEELAERTVGILRAAVRGR